MSWIENMLRSVDLKNSDHRDAENFGRVRGKMEENEKKCRSLSG